MQAIPLWAHAVVENLRTWLRGAAFAGEKCVYGPLEGDGPVTLTNGRKIEFPGCWIADGALVLSHVPPVEFEDRVRRYGLYPFASKKNGAVAVVSAFDYSSSPVGPYREVFTLTYVTTVPNEELTLWKALSYFRLPFVIHPSETAGGFVLDCFIDADDEDIKAQAVLLYQEVFGYGEPARIELNSPESFKVFRGETKLFDVLLPEVARGRVMGFMNKYNYDYYLIGQNKWSRMVTSGYMGQSKNLVGLRFYADPSEAASNSFAKLNQGDISYLSYRNTRTEMHKPTVR